MRAVIPVDDESIKQRKEQRDEDSKHLPWLFELASTFVKQEIEKGEHPEDAYLNASMLLYVYERARGMS